MRTLRQCYTWRAPADAVRGGVEPAENWTSSEGAVEFLRRELSAHGYYSKDTLVSALVDLRSGGRVALSRELGSGDYLHLERVPVTA